MEDKRVLLVLIRDIFFSTWTQTNKKDAAEPVLLRLRPLLSEVSHLSTVMDGALSQCACLPPMVYESVLPIKFDLNGFDSLLEGTRRLDDTTVMESASTFRTKLELLS